MINLIKQESLVMTCMACPSQWDAKTIKGDDVYIRLRHGFMYITVNKEFVFEGYPEGFDGCMTTEEMIDYVNTYSDEVKILA